MNFDFIAFYLKFKDKSDRVNMSWLVWHFIESQASHGDNSFIPITSSPSRYSSFQSVSIEIDRDSCVRLYRFEIDNVWFPDYVKLNAFRRLFHSIFGLFQMKLSAPGKQTMLNDKTVGRKTLSLSLMSNLRSDLQFPNW